MRRPDAALSADECDNKLQHTENAGAPGQARIGIHQQDAAITSSQSGARPPHSKEAGVPGQARTGIHQQDAATTSSQSGARPPHSREAGTTGQALIENHRLNAAYVVRCACDPRPDGTGGETVVDHIRLFPLRDDVRGTYRVHEQILPALRKASVPVRWTDLTVRHTGYVDRDARAGNPTAIAGCWHLTSSNTRTIPSSSSTCWACTDPTSSAASTRGSISRRWHRRWTFL